MRFLSLCFYVLISYKVNLKCFKQGLSVKVQDPTYTYTMNVVFCARLSCLLLIHVVFLRSPVTSSSVGF